MRRSILNRSRAIALAACVVPVACCGPVFAQAPGTLKTPEHDLLKKDVGTWDATMKIFPAPGAEPIVSNGVEKSELFGDGLWLVSEFEGKIGDMPFAGKGTTGYEPVEKKYVGVWFDSMTPFVTTLKGDYDPETKTLTMTAEGRDFESGQMITSKHIAKHIDDDTRTFEIIMPGEGDDQGHKVLEIEYKRRK